MGGGGLEINISRNSDYFVKLQSWNYNREITILYTFVLPCKFVYFLYILTNLYTSNSTLPFHSACPLTLLQHPLSTKWTKSWRSNGNHKTIKQKMLSFKRKLLRKPVRISPLLLQCFQNPFRINLPLNFKLPTLVVHSAYVLMRRLSSPYPQVQYNTLKEFRVPENPRHSSVLVLTCVLGFLASREMGNGRKLASAALKHAQRGITEIITKCICSSH